MMIKCVSVKQDRLGSEMMDVTLRISHAADSNLVGSTCLHNTTDYFPLTIQGVKDE